MRAVRGRSMMPPWLETHSTAALEAGTLRAYAVLVRLVCPVQSHFVPRMSYNSHRCQWVLYPDRPTSSAAACNLLPGCGVDGLVE